MNTLSSYNQTLNKATGDLVTLDTAVMLPVLWGVSKSPMVALGVSIFHQFIHNQLEHYPEGIFSKADDMLPNWLPLDGVLAGTLAYFAGGWQTAVAFAIAHGSIHPSIHSKQKARAVIH